MAARFWQFVLGCQVLYAAIVTATVAATLSPPAAALLPVALASFLSVPLVAVALSYGFGRFTARAAARPVGIGELLWALIRESLAFVVAVLRMIAEPYRELPDARPVSAGPARPLLLIHGILCNRGVWRPWLRPLQELGFTPVRAINLEPLLADLETHAARVVRELEELQRQSHGARVTIVAHSMGGLVARAALRIIGPQAIGHIVTIASPHYGTALARLSYTRPAMQMRPGCPWLKALNATEEVPLPVPVTSLYSLHDNMIVPPRTAALSGADLRELRGLGHLSLLSARRSIDCTLAALNGTL
jgi:triacylglycerol esterase/lipase EstA (alpha/beta hydrolase family)